MNGDRFVIQSVEFDSFEALQSPIADSNLETVQLAPGPVRGSLLKARLGSFAFSTGRFSGSFRSTGPFSQTHFCVGLVLDNLGDATSFGAEVEPGDIISAPPGGEHHMRFGAAHQFALILTTPADLQSSFASEPELDDYAIWADTHRFRANGRIASVVKRRVLAASRMLEAHGPSLSGAAAEFWKRAILEAFATTVILSVPPRRVHIPSPLKLVRGVERYVDSRPHMLIHISEICAALNVSRRTLNRAFYDAVGIGPVAFLRCKRLCAVHTALKRADPSRTRITDIAMEFGFSEMGRFAGHYRSMFGEKPSATLQNRGCSIRMQERR
jgi:AraC family ethanolamine operon transcriptional activator